MKFSPVLNPDGTTGIRAHFDVGDIGAYHALGVGFAPSVGLNDEYLVRSDLARGGELTTKTACHAGPNCRFPDYRGTISWGFSLTQYMADKFDKNRNGLFHYLLYAHSRGKAKSNDGASLDFHVPSSSSGVGIGGRGIITLGQWDFFTGTPFTVTSTTLHEVGHQFGLHHGGAAPKILELPENDDTDSDDDEDSPHDRPRWVRVVEPNSKPNYPSVMSYLFQVRGLLDDAGRAHANFSGAVQG